jgi:hypothetical protein
MKALKDAIVSCPTIVQRLETCSCKRHTAHRWILTLNRGEDWILDEEDDINLGDEEELPLMWEQHLKGRPIDFIKPSCCPEIEYPDFCVEVGSKTPKMLNWKCHTKDQNKKPRNNHSFSIHPIPTSTCNSTNPHSIHHRTSNSSNNSIINRDKDEDIKDGDADATVDVDVAVDSVSAIHLCTVCWTHGGCGHAGAACMYKTQGHQDAATFQNIM